MITGNFTSENTIIEFLPFSTCRQNTLHCTVSLRQHGFLVLLGPSVWKIENRACVHTNTYLLKYFYPYPACL